MAFHVYTKKCVECSLVPILLVSHTYIWSMHLEPHWWLHVKILMCDISLFLTSVQHLDSMYQVVILRWKYNVKIICIDLCVN